ncbi:MAG TPA: hypothetical protein PK156_25255 [Polyangium sp.]|nr:hypothetical protein [Polyangium sp.]
MSGELRLVDGGGGPTARCKHCGAQAVGPCAQCRGPVCGDCCVLTEGGVKVWAICLSCRNRSGSSLRRGWWMVLTWLVVPILLLALLVGLLETCGRKALG